jgi:hypothetical protein
MLCIPMSWKIVYKFPSCNVDIEIVLSLPYKRDCKMGVKCMVFIYVSIIGI